MKQYGKMIDVQTGVESALFVASELEEKAKKWSEELGRVVQIYYQCVICNKFFCPTEAYKKEFCSEDCYM